MTSLPLDRRTADAEDTPGARPPPPAAPPTLGAALSYDGTNGELFRLWVRTTVLALATFGIYRFWGRTRVRRYLWSRLSLLDDRFEYDGTGMELFVRFLLAVAVVLLPLAAIGIGLEFSGWPRATIAALKYLMFIVILFLSYVGHYTGQRYRLSRSLWRGIRSGLDGSAWRYGWRAMGFTVLQPLTLGLNKPWRYAGLWRYEARYTRLGSRHLSFIGRGRDLFRTWLIAVVLGTLSFFGLALAFGALVAIVVGLIVVASKGSAAGWKTLMAPLIAGGAISYVTFLVLLWLVWIAITARFERDWLVYSTAGTALGDLRFGLEADTRSVRRLRIGNLLLTVLTLNLAWPFVAQRTLRFYARTLRLDVTGIERLSQSEVPSRPPASGIAELFDTTGFA